MIMETATATVTQVPHLCATKKHSRRSAPHNSRSLSSAHSVSFWSPTKLTFLRTSLSARDHAAWQASGSLCASSGSLCPPPLLPSALSKYAKGWCVPPGPSYKRRSRAFLCKAAINHTTAEGASENVSSQAGPESAAVAGGVKKIKFQQDELVSVTLDRRVGDGADAGPKKAVVVGGGWAGFGAAYQLASCGFAVTLVDASPDPGGLSGGFRTSQGRAVEAGMKGFWYQYHNIYRLIDELGIPPPFTEWTRSSFYSPAGIQVEAPVFQDLPRLPTPLGSFLYTSPYFRSLPVADRLTAIPLIQALVEFDVDEEAYAYYDSMTARELFRRAGVSARLYREFLEPILLVTLFAPGEQLSAAAALGALYYYVLAHQADFDVRWCRAPVVESIFAPWRRKLEAMGATILGGQRVQKVTVDDVSGRATSITAVDSDGQATTFEADAVVFAVGVNAMQRIVATSPALADRPDYAGFSNLGGIDVLAARLWLDREVTPPNPSNVFSGFDPSTGGTFFDLNALQDEYRDEAGSVIEVDFYHANQLLPLPDDVIVDRVLGRYLAGCEPAFAGARVLDASVLRFKGAVTLFGPGSHQHMPTTATSIPNLFMAGDWLAQGPGSHGARGLSQEKAYVTGLEAGRQAAALLNQGQNRAISILSVEEDEPHIATAKAVSREGRRLLRSTGFAWPLLL